MIKAAVRSVPKYGKNKPAAAPKNNRSAVSNRKNRCPKRRENRSPQDLHFRDWKHGKRKEDTGMNTAAEKENRKNLKMADSIASLTAQKGGRAYFVGGFVRDKILGWENKDVDMEIHGVTPAAVERDSLQSRTAGGNRFQLRRIRPEGIRP